MLYDSIPADLETKSDNDPVDEVKTALAGLTSDVKSRLDAMEAKLNRPELDGEAKDDDDLEGKALSQWLRTGSVDNETKTLVSGTASAGGYTVAPEYATNVITKITEINPMRQLANVMSIGTGKVYIPTLASDASGGWVTEVASRPSSEPTFGQVEIDVYEHAVVIPVSRVLLEDSFINLPAFLADRIAVKFAQAEADAFLTGDGSGKPTGIVDNPAAFSGVSVGTDIIEDIVDLFYSLKTAYAARGSWLMSRETMGAIRKAADVASGRGAIWSDGIGGGTPARLLGAPVYEASLDTYGSSAATGVVAMFGDFNAGYQVVDRVGVEIMRDDYTGADNGIVKFRARKRVGGKLVLPEALVALKS